MKKLSMFLGVLIFSILLAGCSGNNNPTRTNATNNAPTSSVKIDTKNNQIETKEKTKDTNMQEKKQEEKTTQNPIVEIETNMGNIEVELYPQQAPKTVKNFLAYVDSKFYNGTIFHRVINGFMIQGGGFTENLQQKQTMDPISIESDNGLKNDRGTIAMARTSDPNSATSQFFINTVNNSFLNYSAPTVQGYGYAVFGKVIKGMDVVDKIEKVKTTTQGYMGDVPVNPVIINKIVEKK